ncbi:Lipase 1 [Sulfurospirillum diekertiae]|uniref:Lipase 1 n=1 Tax=Sulfurospirillum diekertiae TaxID=1854492 RepID=A0A1Y0HK44_9BACT|nr:alpha/beta hydrolase [Sulfurospirillum diekertiae]ARU48499.1 Lipase 1 [Sulfurospirillum diekertiae]
MNNLTRHTATVYGQDISFLEMGSGSRCILLMHGLGTQGANWEPILKLLANDGWHVIAPDHLGFGLSSKPNIKIKPSTLADVMEEFIKILQLKNPILVGQSMGGHIAGLMASRSPKSYSGLILSNAGYGVALPKNSDGHTPGGLKMLNPSNKEETQKLLSAVFYNKEKYVTPEAVDELFAWRLSVQDGQSVASIIDSWSNGDEPLDNILHLLVQLPILIIQSTEDEITPVHLSHRLHEGIAESELALIQECGHEPATEATEKVFTK